MHSFQVFVFQLFLCVFLSFACKIWSLCAWWIVEFTQVSHTHPVYCHLKSLSHSFSSPSHTHAHCFHSFLHYSVYTMQLMLECKHVVERQLPIREKQNLNYTQIGEKAWGLFGKWAVNLSVLLCNLGVCAGYMIFISSNLQVSVIRVVHTGTYIVVSIISSTI